MLLLPVPVFFWLSLAVQLRSLEPVRPLNWLVVCVLEAVEAGYAFIAVAALAITGAASTMIAAKPETSVRVFILVTPRGLRFQGEP